MSCKYIFRVGTNAGKQCTRVPRTGEYCYRHINCRHGTAAATIVNDEVFGTARTAQPAGSAEVARTNLKSSVYAITIVSNTVFDEMTTADKQKYKKFIDFVFQRDNCIRYLTDYTADSPADNIVEMRIEYFHEIAAATRYLHTHALVDLVHTGYYKYRVDDLRAVCEKVFAKKFHINVVASADPGIHWKNYIRKQQSVNMATLADV